MTRLVTSVLCEGPEATRQAVAAVLATGADLVEIRLDGWADDGAPFAAVAEVLPPGRWMVTCRPVSEGGLCVEDTSRRVSRLLEALLGGDGYLDFEFAEWQRSANIRQKVRLALASRGAGNPDQPRLILSVHDLRGRPADPAGLLKVMSAERDLAAVKLAWQADDICDNLVAFDLLRQTEAPAIVICLGEAGLMSRVLARKFNAFATYCAPAPGAETAPGQATLADMLQRYRWRSISASTRVFGVIGHPVAHSMSPILFSACFERQGLDAVYLPLHIGPSAEVLRRFLSGCVERPWLDVGGFSVTMPHKQAAAEFVGERIEPLARRVGAVNTLVPRGGGFEGFNTDCPAALDAITESLGCERSDLGSLRADVLGAGGVAWAVVAGLRHYGAAITVYNRTAARGDALASEFGCRSEPWARRGQMGAADLVVNCTSIGMTPNVDGTPLPSERLAAQPAVFDVVYNPVQTRLLREAEQAGCRTIDGLTMFVNQAAAQFELWTGQPADKRFMRETVECALGS